MKKRKWLSCLLTFTLVLAALSIGQTGVSHALSGKNIAVYAGTGADSRSVTAICASLAKMGHYPMTVIGSDLNNGRLNTGNFDIFILPGAENADDTGYLDYVSGGAIQSFVSAGGGFIGIETGACFVSSTMNWNGASTNYATDLYSGTAYGALTDIGEGMAQISIMNSSFGTVGDKYTVYVSKGAPYFSEAAGATVFADYSNGSGSSDGDAAIIGFQYGAGGYCCLVGPNLELEEDDLTDMAIWDNLKASFYDPESDAPLLAKLVEYADGGTILNDTTITEPTVSGKRIAVYSYHDLNGGAWGALLPPVFRALTDAGYSPIAITPQDIKNNKLTTANFDAIIFPGGNAYGYSTQLAGNESKITDFVSSGGGCIGICAGSFYLSDDIGWLGESYAYPVDLFEGVADGPIESIAPWPYWDMTSIQVTDSGIGVDDSYNMLYYGGPYFRDYDPSQTITDSAFYTDYSNEPAIIRFAEGNGRVVLFGPHPEAEEGSTNDWAYFDGYAYSSTAAISDSESDWDLLEAYLDWVTASTSSSPISPDGTTLGVSKTTYDTTNDSIGDAQAKDKTGNSPASKAYNDGFYTVVKNGKMELTGFGKGFSGTINSVTLKVRYSVQSGYNGTNDIYWSTDGVNYAATTIRPANGQTNYEATYNLKTAGVDTINELLNLRIWFWNQSGTSRSVSFDYVQVTVN